MRVAILLVVALGLAVAACGGAAGGSERSGDELPSDPGEAMLQIHEYVRNGQWAREWEHLHAAHQEIAARDEFVSCGGAVPAFSSRVIEVFDETITGGAGIGKVETKAITVELSTGVGDAERSQRSTAHLVEVDGAWRWMLTNDELDAYEAGECP